MATTCDSCGGDMTGQKDITPVVKKQKDKAEQPLLLRKLDGDFCHHCVIDAFKKCDDRKEGASKA